MIGLVGLVVVRLALAVDVEIVGKFVSAASSGPPLKLASSELAAVDQVTMEVHGHDWTRQ